LDNSEEGDLESAPDHTNFHHQNPKQLEVIIENPQATQNPNKRGKPKQIFALLFNFNSKDI